MSTFVIVMCLEHKTHSTEVLDARYNVDMLRFEHHFQDKSNKIKIAKQITVAACIFILI